MAQITLNSSGVASNGSLVLQSNGTTTAVTVDTSQNVGIGTSSPSTKLHVFSGAATITGAASTTARINMFNNGATTNGFLLGQGFASGTDNIAYLYNVANAAMAFGTFDLERMRIDSIGNVLVGTTNSSPSAGVGIKNIYSATDPYISVVGAGSTNATNGFLIYSTGASAYRFYVSLGGTIFATNTTISAISDIRFKENVRDLDAGLDKIMSLKPRLYDWKQGKGADIKNARGFIAQEFEAVFPDLIDEWKDPAPEGEEPYKSVRADLIPVLVKAIQEQQALITALTTRITALEQA